MDKNISNTNSDLNTRIDINENRIKLIMWIILAGLGYYIYMIWDKL